MRWPWRRGCRRTPLRPHHDQSLAEAERHLAELERQRAHVHELEELAKRERAANHFSARIRKGLGGTDA